MARGKKTESKRPIESYEHRNEQRVNNPPVERAEGAPCLKVIHRRGSVGDHRRRERGKVCSSARAGQA